MFIYFTLVKTALKLQDWGMFRISQVVINLLRRIEK
jgi:hypothetical protein